jgi:hypothetical protein
MQEVFRKIKSDYRDLLENSGVKPNDQSYEKLKKMHNGSVITLAYLTGATKFFPYRNYPIGLEFFYRELETLLLDDEKREIFAQELSKNDILKMLPVEEVFLPKWQKVLTSLINSYVNNNKYTHQKKLNLGDPSNNNVRKCYLDLGGLSEYSIKTLRYGGIMSVVLMNEICHNITIKMHGKYYHFKPN